MSSSSSLRPLPCSVRSLLRSSVTINSAAQCVRELVHNSLDAGAARIALHLDLPGLRLRVRDDGAGVGRTDLAVVADRHMTSRHCGKAGFGNGKSGFGRDSDGKSRVGPNLDGKLSFGRESDGKLSDSDGKSGFGGGNDVKSSVDQNRDGKSSVGHENDSQSCFGCRGEALASLRDVAGFLQIVSKTERDSHATVALFLKGCRRRLTRYARPFPHRSGTVVSVMDFLHNVPVRQRAINPGIELEECRKVVESLALSRPRVAFTLTDDSSGEKILETRGGGEERTEGQAFCELFGSHWTTLLRPVDERDVGNRSRRLRGFVATEAAAGKSRQFLCVNGRPVEGNSQLVKAVRDVLKRSVMCRPAARQFRPEQRLPESPTKTGSGRTMQPVFYLDIRWPEEECELLLDPCKTSVEFADWTQVCEFARSALNAFLRDNALLPPDLMISSENERGFPNRFDETGIVPLPLMINDKNADAEEAQFDASLGCEPLEQSDDEEETDDDECGKSRSGYFANVDGARMSKAVKRRKEKLEEHLKRFRCDDEDAEDVQDVQDQDGEAAKCDDGKDEAAKSDNGKDEDAKDEDATEIVPEGWMRKVARDGKTYFVQLSSGITVDDARKCCKRTIRPPKRTFRKSSARTFNVLPPGKTPFLPVAKRRKMLPSASKDASEDAFSHSKWRDESTQSSDLNSTKNNDGKSARDILESWQNPTFAVNSEICDLRPTSRSTKINRQSFRFDKSMFDRLRVIGQVDRKFIAATVTTNDDDDDDGGSEFLVMFDQHAVHERIRLEALIEDNFPGQHSVLSQPLSPPINITLSSEESRVLSRHREVLSKFGMELDGQIATRAPVCFLQREASELKYHRPSPLSDLLHSCFRDVASSLLETGGAAGVILPTTISNVLNSQACRQAVKFGDRLPLATCRRLLEQLSRCKAPFQCAHGRPSGAPIADLKGVLKAMPRTRMKLEKVNLLSFMAATEEEDEQEAK